MNTTTPALSADVNVIIPTNTLIAIIISCGIIFALFFLLKKTIG